MEKRKRLLLLNALSKVVLSIVMSASALEFGDDNGQSFVT